MGIGYTTVESFDLCARMVKMHGERQHIIIHETKQAKHVLTVL